MRLDELKTSGAIHLGPEGPSFLASWDKKEGKTVVLPSQN